ncbi:uncharacterized protein SRS1_10528 [Sporisorium reilianum f. sp. reilianum]|uniref:Uncharacterized protein n=1 Tax=Sporisorium reilianum f. sp. reilianum TaxID=72559 RepID=A0A2N8U9Q3_9BASI|nr:uncharacterized protein SRS1_10528 [Sporisorium reilianum f. sp. reilianum]
MHRHDGTEYVSAIFAGQPPHAPQVIALMRMTQELTTWNLPIIITQTLLVAEIIRTYPAELRMLTRLVQRKKPNMAEIFFVLIKYLALVAVTLDILVMMTFAPQTDFDCRSWAWTSSTLYFVCSTLVFCVVGWRARIIFRTCRVASYLLAVGLVGQFSVAMWTNTRVSKVDALTPAGTCAPAAQMHGGPNANAALTIKFWQSSTFWFLLYNTLFESAVMLACCVRLKRTSSGPMGLTQIAKVLFVNNVHYMAGVETCNFVELVMLLGWASSLPPVHMTSIAIQIVVGLQMLIGEQEAVYSPSCSTYSSGYASTNGTYVNKHAHTATSSSSNFTAPGHTLSYVKRPGTANTDMGYPARKNTFSSCSSVPAYVRSSPTEELAAPQPPSKSTIPYRQDVTVSVDVSGQCPLPAHAQAAAPAPPMPYL